ncbi:MAG: DegV family protein [Oenococcus sp.]|uniref:DegV family protein n=1 Tax=Oenococcus sp. TaxID=1979414 RepID=UPI0039E9199C
MSKIAIIVDSSSYIPHEIQLAKHIYVADNPVLFGRKVYHESHWPVNAAFYKQMATSSAQPTTSQPSIGDLMAIFDQVKKDGYDQAVLVTLSSGFSGTYQAAFAAAAQYPDLDVHVWDSRIATMGAGNQALLASDLAEKGWQMADILEKLRLLRDRTSVFFVVDSIKHLQRTGRLSGGQALIAGLLSIKPILNIDPSKEGKIVAVAKERKMTGAWKYIEENFGKIVEGYAHSNWPMRVTIVDADNPALADSWVKKGKALWPDIVFERGIIGPLIGVHTGEKAVGFIWAQDYKSLED